MNQNYLKSMDNFEVYLVSNGSMQLYPNNTLASFTNHLSEPLQLDGNWRVSLSSISIPTAVKNISNGDFIGFNKTRTRTRHLSRNL